MKPTLGFGDDNEITLTHVHNSGLTLNSTSKINLIDDGTFIQQTPMVFSI